MRPTRALIHRRHLLSNWEQIRGRLAPGTALCPAVKANAYGHGAVEVARLLAGAGADAFGVATVDEGRELRAAGIVQPILLFGTLQSDELCDAVEADLDLFVGSVAAVDAVARAAVGRSKPVRLHVKVDTGMGRVGCAPEEAEVVAGAIVHHLNLELTGLCTHLASSDGPGPVEPPAQLARFQQAVDTLKARGWQPRFVHASNSGAIASWPQAHFNLVRPGIALYGYGPDESQLTPVMELVSKVGQVRTVPGGTPLSYGSKYTTSRTTDVAVIPLGYADGYRRGFTNRAPLLVDGRPFTVSGTVCMDQFMVDLGPDSGVKVGAPVTLFGPAPAAGAAPPSAEDLARLEGTISYEMLCGIAARVPRILVD